MENELREITNYAFLIDPIVERAFADLNIALLSGRHLHFEDHSIFSALEDYVEDWRAFYKNLYKLNLVRDVYDGQTYYYLDFFDGSKGRLNDQSRYRALTTIQTITGLVLLNIYYQRYFDQRKIVLWADLRKQIEEGEHKEDYQRILFKTVRPSYTETEWQTAEKRFRDAIISFDKLGWVNKQSVIGEELVFEIKPAIHRLEKLYSEEIENFDLFAQNLKSEDQL